jgi:hypothetical protein
MWCLNLGVQLLLRKNLFTHICLLKTWSQQLIWDPLLPPLGPCDLKFPFESDLTICRSSSLCACDSLLIDSANPDQNIHHHMEYGQFASPFGIVDPPRSRYFSDIELPSDEAILEAMTTDYIQWEDLHRSLCFLPFWETFQVDYRSDSWSKPNNELFFKPFSYSLNKKRSSSDLVLSRRNIYLA